MDAFKKEFEQQLLQVQIEVQEHTYRHIAKELHDNVGQLLSTTKMLMGVTEIKLGSVPDTLNTANATLSKAIQEIRFLSRSMDKEWLEQFNFLENLKSEVERLNAGEMVQATVHCSTEIAMKPEEQIILFRIVQEAIQNAVRHAGPTQLDVIISGSAEALEVKVANNGAPLPQNFHGMGTNNMRHRARLFGGTVHWLPVQEGTVVTICLPSKKTA
jgi:signal transduction histidine kinase